MPRQRRPALLAALAAMSFIAACADLDGGRAPAEPTISPRIATLPPTAQPSASPAVAETPATEAPDVSLAPTPTQAPATPAPTFDPGALALSFEPFASELGRLTFMTHAGDGSGLLYAVEQAGAVMVVEPDGSVRQQPFLDIGDRVQSGGEQGLLGLAFHPQYADNRRFFVNYTDSNGDTVVAEFQRSADTQADPGSERIVLTIEQPFGNHNGGMLAFGPEGKLYISTGDGGGAGDPVETGQDLSSLLGAILRIDVDSDEPYVVPSDNPFIGREAARPEIWAYGLRNPWRFSFDRATGDLFIADVGQNAWEEVNAEAAGDGGHNYGWNIMEGPACFGADDCDMSGLTLPAAWYALDGDHCAVTGGYVYRGEQYPELSGGYLFSDYCSGIVWALDAATAVAQGEATFSELGSQAMGPSAFAEDEAGELYLVGHNGEIVRLAARPR